MFVQITSGPWREPKIWGNVLSLSESHFQVLTNQGHFRKKHFSPLCAWIVLRSEEEEMERKNELQNYENRNIHHNLGEK